MRSIPSKRFPSPRLPYALAGVLLLALLAAGCAHMPRMLGGSADVQLTLDGEQDHTTELPLGHTLTLELRDPSKIGYVFVGTSFDASLLRLDGIVPYDDGARVRYVFTALAQGECDVQIKIRRTEPGYRPDVYKRVRVTIQP